MRPKGIHKEPKRPEPWRSYLETRNIALQGLRRKWSESVSYFVYRPSFTGCLVLPPGEFIRVFEMTGAHMARRRLTRCRVGLNVRHRSARDQTLHVTRKGQNNQPLGRLSTW